MKRERAKLASDSIRTFHYNTRFSSSCIESRVETSDAIVESTSAPVRVKKRRKKILDDRRSNSYLLLIDVIMEILKRLPVKTLARFLCVSKLWASTMRLQCFRTLFLTESLNRPGRLFITFKRDDNNQDSFFFSSLQTRNTGEASVATYHMEHPSYRDTVISSSVHGVFCYKTACGFGLMVYNSSTRRSITLPKFEHKSFFTHYFLGYDHIDDVYKVLCLTRPRTERVPVFQVLKLGNGNSWKVIENIHTHIPFKCQICIDGVVYYEVFVGKEHEEVAVMSFDVRSKNSMLSKYTWRCQFSVGFGCRHQMIRYKGKLAVICSLLPANGRIVLWVLEDAAKHE